MTLSDITSTLSFYGKADSSKNIAIEFRQDFGNGGTPSVSVQSIGVTTINLTTSWQKFTITVDVPSISGKTLGTDGDDNLQVIFWFDAGSDYNSNTNSLGNQSGTFDIAQVQLEEGSVATSFEQRPIGVEVDLCLRYYEKGSFNIGSAYAGSGGRVRTTIGIYNKRTTPTVSTSNVSESSLSSWDLIALTPSNLYGTVLNDASSGNFYVTGDFQLDAEL